MNKQKYSFYRLKEEKLQVFLEKNYREIKKKLSKKNDFLFLEIEAEVELVNSISKNIQNNFSDYLYSLDDSSLEESLVKKLREEKLTLATAESCTGGLVAEKLTRVSGSSEVFRGAIVSYVNEIKETILDVPSEVLNSLGAVSQETSFYMAKGVQKKIKSDIALSVTGVAGPDKSEGKEVGLVYFTLLIKDEESFFKMIFSGNRIDIRRQSAEFILFKLLKKLDN